MKFRVIDFGTPEYKLCVSLREEILRKPLGLGFTEEEIAAENGWIHIVAYQDGKLCATAALIPEKSTLAKICRVAVLAELQGQGIGTEIMRYAEAYAAKRGFEEVYLHARDTSVPFYLKNQYIAEGDWFDEDTVPHKKLRKILGSAEGVCASYGKIVDWFDNARTKILMEKEYLDLALTHLKPGASILDLGCGTGEPIARFFIEHGMNITGIDGSPKMVALCQQRFPEQQWQVGDMRKINLNRKFDTIIAWDSFFHLSCDDQRKMFTIFKAHIAEGGIFIFTSGTKEGEVYGMMDGQSFYHASLALEEYKKLLAEYGFTVLLHKVEDPDCGEHTVWVVKYENV